MTRVSGPYDHKREQPGGQASVTPLRPPDWDWAFETDGALALEPEHTTDLQAQVTPDTVPPMAQPQAQGLAYRAAEREQIRASVRRSRRTAALLVAACVSLVLLLLTAFGTGPAPS